MIKELNRVVASAWHNLGAAIVENSPCREFNCPVKPHCKIKNISATTGYSLSQLVTPAFFQKEEVQKSIHLKHCLAKVQECPGWGDASVDPKTGFIQRW